jgi:hypothetical protein
LDSGREHHTPPGFWVVFCGGLVGLGLVCVVRSVSLLFDHLAMIIGLVCLWWGVGGCRVFGFDEAFADCEQVSCWPHDGRVSPQEVLLGCVLCVLVVCLASW